MLPYIFARLRALLPARAGAAGLEPARRARLVWRVLAVNVVQLGIVVVAGFTWERWAARASLPAPVRSRRAAMQRADRVLHRDLRLLLVASRRGTNSDWLWRGFHQIHHSPQRLEVITSFYKHPLEMTVNSMHRQLARLLPARSRRWRPARSTRSARRSASSSTTRTCGRRAGSDTVFQRPEMHRIHHEHGRHRTTTATSCGGTCCSAPTRNPARRSRATCGFDDAREQRLGDDAGAGAMSIAADRPAGRDLAPRSARDRVQDRVADRVDRAVGADRVGV